jgi:hypothetical protein
MRLTSRLARRGAAGAALATLALAAGGSGSAANAVIFGPQATPPVLAGDVFHYAGKSVSTSTSPGSKPVVKDTTESFTISVSGNATFDKRSGLTKLAFEYAGVTESVAEYVGFTPAGGVMQERAYGATVTEKDTGQLVTSTETIAAGQILDEYPEVAGLRWNPAATSVTVVKLTGSGEAGSGKDVSYADGSYSDFVSANIGGGAFVTEITDTLDATGAGSIVGVQTGTNKQTVTFGLPVKAKSGFAIPVTSAGGNNLPAKPTPAKTVHVPDWFPSHDLASRPLYDASIVNEGLVSTPATCGARARVKAFDVRSTETTLDPVGGFYDVAVYDEYDAAGLGNVCATETDMTYFYDNGPPLGPGTGKLTSTSKLVSVSVLTSESGPKPLFARGAGAAPFSLDIRQPRALRFWSRDEHAARVLGLQST